VNYKNVQFACKKLDISLDHQPKLLEHENKVNAKKGRAKKAPQRKGRGKKK
jgi:hypothetical protein